MFDPQDSMKDQQSSMKDQQSYFLSKFAFFKLNSSNLFDDCKELKYSTAVFIAQSNELTLSRHRSGLNVITHDYDQRNLDDEHSQAIASPSDATPPIIDQVNSSIGQYFSRIAFAVLFY
jgi:hypothetical protein